MQDFLVGFADDCRDYFEVQLRSGRTGERLRSTHGIWSNSEHDHCLAPYVDLDGDGIGEALSTHCVGIGSSVLVLRGSDGSVMLEIQDPFASCNGRFLDAKVDWDGKGLPDIVLGTNVPTDGVREFCILSMEDDCALRFVDSEDITRVIAAEADAADH